jgi:hypothetical protein
MRRRSLRRADLAEEIVDLAAQLRGLIAQHLRSGLDVLRRSVKEIRPRRPRL